jgi:hypothetical protein
VNIVCCICIMFLSFVVLLKLQLELTHSYIGVYFKVRLIEVYLRIQSRAETLLIVIGQVGGQKQGS